MSEQNPYQAPESEVVGQESEVNLALSEIKALPAGGGWQWISRGFGLFKASPGIWIGVLLLLFVLNILLQFIPLLGPLVSYVIMPVFLGGLMLGCKEQEGGGDLKIEHLFAGFSNNTSQLLIVGAIYVVYFILIAVVIGGIVLSSVGGMNLFFNPESVQVEDPTQIVGAFSTAILLGLLLFIPFMMAYWFAPALVILNNISAIEAMKMSFKGCLRNMLPFLLYGLILLVLSVLAAIPLALGYLVLGPVVVASIYIGYRDIFTNT